MIQIRAKYWQICVELFKRRNLSVCVGTKWGIHKKQELALQLLTDNKTKIVGYGGSARSGKSWIACEYLTMMCLAYPDVGYGLARRELKTIKRTTLLTLFKVFKKYKLVLNEDFKFNQQDLIITFNNGSQIFIIDTAYAPSDPEYLRFGGYELTGVVIDESNESPYEAIEILFSRCGFRHNNKYGIMPKMLEMFNPNKGHVYTRFWLPYKNGLEPEDKKFIKALPLDNPDPEVKVWMEGVLKNASTVTKERLVDGNFEYDDADDKLVSTEDIANYFTNSYVKEEGRKYITADIARFGKDSTVIRVWHGYSVIYRREIIHSSVDNTASEIRNIANQHQVTMSCTIVDEDGVGGGVRDILKCHGFIANKKPVGITNYSNLKAQCGFHVAKLITEGKLYEKCDNKSLETKIRQELDWLRQRYIDEDGKKLCLVPKDVIKENIGRSPDDLDTIIMRAYFDLGQRV